ncbi:ABC transporter ATP-binding protein [candidate division TA06 bacterium]|uniref:ABC transporter ATP-binding protein n=1 Tax=candidate division TA06 bacterium TaxID=2250710 RepID=A0A523UTC4_UNCT6|nr:MAG: ABC transporter ATP-binding protein [candidate division TA06 bacterium]
MKPVLETRLLTKIYKSPIAQKKVKAVDGLSVAVVEGEIFGFLGPNAAGKTTTIKMLTGLLSPTSGEALLFGEKLGNASLRMKMGFLPEQPYFYPYLTGVELLDFCAQIFGMRTDKRRVKVEQLLDMVDLRDAGRMRISSYSRGMLQRIGLAQALINDPELVILDEPLAGLDPIGRRDVRDIILKMKKEGKTVFFSSHILPDVEMICDRVGILINGRLMSVGRLDELLKEEVESIEITVEGLDGSHLEKLGAKGERVIVSGDRVMIEVSHPEVASKIQGEILAAGGRVVSLVPRKKTLEEHFMKEIGAYWGKALENSCSR